MVKSIRTDTDRAARAPWLLPRWAAPWLIAAAHLYFVGLSGWLLAWAIYGDRWSWLFALNSFAIYWFVPLPLIALLAALTRRGDIWVWTVMTAVVWAYLFGHLFLPRLPAAQASGPTVRVLTTNILGFNTDSEAVINTIRAAHADVVAIQELNPENAAAIERELAELYPYRILDHRPGVTGAGVLSRYPMQQVGHLPGSWLGTAQLISVTIEGRTITLIRAHAYSGIRHVGDREETAEILAQYVARHPDVPIIAAGDFNATPLSRSYRMITQVLADSWAEVGWGFGHTFPGAMSPGSSRPELAGIPVPRWLVRIDYVFHSDDFVALSANIGPWDGNSDHRPVLVELAFKE